MKSPSSSATSRVLELSVKLNALLIEHGNCVEAAAALSVARAIFSAEASARRDESQEPLAASLSLQESALAE